MLWPKCLKIQVLSEANKRIFACLNMSSVRVVTGRKKEKHTVILCSSVRTMISFGCLLFFGQQNFKKTNEICCQDNKNYIKYGYTLL